MKTSTLVLLTLTLTVVLSYPLFAEEKWTAEQKEIIAFEEKLMSLNKPEQLDELMAMFHPSYLSWYAGRPQPVPLQRKWMEYVYKNSETTLWSLFPLAVNVYGNFAYIDYYVVYVEHDKKKDEDKIVREGWTDILIKENGKWVCVGAHGSEFVDK